MMEMEYQLILLKHIWFLDVSSGFEEIGERCAEHVDDGDEGGSVSVAASAGSGGLEEPVQGLQACVGMG
jgi:hypothetical protein